MKKVLCVDVGNTAIKAAIVSGGEVDALYWLSKENLQTELEKLLQDHKISAGIGCSVGRLEGKDEALFSKIPDFLFIHAQTPLPIKVDYTSKETLGMDRVAGVVGARAVFAEGPLLVIDCGTCITYDFLSKDDIYKGGAISPGVSMRFKALNTQTARLPLVSPVGAPALIGNSTENSIRSGVMNGILHEMDGMIGALSAQYGGLKALLTGGDAHYFEKELENTIFAAPNLVLSGLYHILIHQTP